ncbi:MAG: alpha/beta hydrolase [Acidimicrobiales bacterium]
MPGERTIPDGLHVIAHEPEDPTAPRVVLVHGAMDRSTSFAKVARRLADLRVVRYDRRGYGHSRALGVGDLDTHVADLLAVVGEEPAVVVGHSMGGTLALIAASRRPGSIRSVMAYESPLPWIPAYTDDTGDQPMFQLSGDPANAAERFMRHMVGSSRWERLPARTRADRRAEGPALVADITAMRTSKMLIDLRSLAMPVLAVHGSAASDRHRRATEYLAEHVPGGELHVIEGSDHGAHLTHADAFAALVRRTVERAV